MSSSTLEQREEEKDEQKQCFTPIHQDKKRLPQPICIATLCPTMDLAAVGLHKQSTLISSSSSGGTGVGKNNIEDNCNDNDNTDTSITNVHSNSISQNNVIKIYASSTIMIYRSIKWEKMFIINQTDVSTCLSDKLILDQIYNVNDNNNDDDNNHDNNDQSTLASSITWSPDGRTLVLGLHNGSILLYDIESCASPGVTPKPTVCLPCPPSLPLSSSFSFQNQTTGTDTGAGNTIAVSDGAAGIGPSLSDDDEDKTYDDSIKIERSNSGKSTASTYSYSSSSSSIPQYSPAVTRSMTAARRKKVADMINKAQSKMQSSIMNTKQDYTQNTTATATSAPANNNYTNNNMITMDNLKLELSMYKHTIASLHWQRMKPSYKDWKHTNDVMNQNVSWYYQLHYLDKAKHFLPPCAYNLTYPDNNYNVIDDGYGGGSSISSLYGVVGGVGGGSGSISNAGNSRQSSEHLDHHNDFMESLDSHRPKCQTPLSVLFSVTCGNGMHLYLQGRYRILSLPYPIVLCNRSTSITASMDLSSFLVCTKSIDDMKVSPSLMLYTLPDLATKRYQLQIITSSYCSIMSHLTALHEGMKETQGAWLGSLRQLDTKFDQLSTLLTKYGVMPSHCDTTIKKMTVVRRELMNYILGGHSNRSTNTSNAMDQFFTHPLMNDQLLQRLVKSLEANVAGVEGIIRKKLLGPVRALMYDVGELHGQIKAMNVDASGYHYGSIDGVDGLDIKLPLINEQTSLRLYEASEVLFFIAEQCVSQLVEIRFRLSCMMKWIRGTASQVKARGTAADSVQRENAKKRRVPEQILRKVADFLSTSLHAEGPEGDTIKCGSSECVLGILLSDYFCKNKVSIETPPAPLTTRQINCNTIPPVQTPSMKAALEISTQIALDLFDEPRVSLKQSLNEKHICLDSCGDFTTEEVIVTVHNRIGAAPDSADDVENCFNPNLKSMNSLGNVSQNSRNWFIIANTCSSKIQGCNVVQISALPGCYSMSENDDIEIVQRDEISFYLTSFIVLPIDSQVTNIKFYSNDGNSTLTSETSPNNEEGKQELGVMTRKTGGEEDLWLFGYDNLNFRLIPLRTDETNSKNIHICKFDGSMDQYSYLTRFKGIDEDKYDVVYSKCK